MEGRGGSNLNSHYHALPFLFARGTEVRLTQRDVEATNACSVAGCSGECGMREPELHGEGLGEADDAGAAVEVDTGPKAVLGSLASNLRSRTVVEMARRTRSGAGLAHQKCGLLQ